MREHIQKHRKKYAILVFIVIVALIVFLILGGFSIFSKPNIPKGNLELSFGDKSIKSGESTTLKMGAKNVGTLPLNAEFVASVDDSDSVKMSYTAPELLKFSLLPGESIERVMNITGTSKAYKTYYKITVSIKDQNYTYATKSAIFTVNGE